MDYDKLSKLAQKTLRDIDAAQRLRRQGRPALLTYPGRLTPKLIREGWIVFGEGGYKLTASARAALPKEAADHD